MPNDKPKCTRDYHDSFGENYEDCEQCFVRDNGPWDENPWLKSIEKPDDTTKE